MTNIITVDFAKKKRILDYDVTRWSCLCCLTVYSHDSRDKNNMPRIIMREGHKTQLEACICKPCAKLITDIINSGGI